MHQAGMRVPAAEGARLPVFGRVMADIGDEQSIAQSLSTFSSHLRNVVRFVEAAGPATLVLLDEVGAGTDPAEGSALAMAIVTRLLDAGAMVAATTHYAELKTFATEHPGVSNAAVEFDVTTLRPTYRLTIGLPGRARHSRLPSVSGCRAGSWPMPASASRRSTPAWRRRWRPSTRPRRGPGRALEAAQAERAAAADERELAEPAWRCARGGRQLLADARRAADELVARAEREVADLRREMTRQRNLGGGKARRERGRLRRSQPSGRPGARGDGGRSVDGGRRRGDEVSRPAATRRAVGPLADARQHRAHRRDQRPHRAGYPRDRGRAPRRPGRRRRGRAEPISGPAPRDLEAEELRRRAAQRVSPPARPPRRARRSRPRAPPPPTSTTRSSPASTRS